MTSWIDISPVLNRELAPWPGDQGFELTWSSRLERGASVNVGAFTASTHTGSHLDAPAHFQAGGRTIDQLPIELFVGECRVVQIVGTSCIEPKHLASQLPIPTRRLLIATGAWPDPRRFPREIPVLTLDADDWLAAAGVELLGVDLPSVDELTSREMPNHHRLAGHGITILEGLRLSEAAAGLYTLVALPLRIEGGDASPVRAVLSPV